MRGVRLFVVGLLLLAACSSSTHKATSAPTTVKDTTFSNATAKKCAEILEKGGTVDSCPPNTGVPIVEPDGESRLCGSLTNDGAIDVVEFSELTAAGAAYAYGKYPGVDAFVRTAGRTVAACVVNAPAPALPSCKRGNAITVLVSGDGRRRLTLPCGARSAIPGP